jgi:hypothetical protein
MNRTTRVLNDIYWGFCKSTRVPTRVRVHGSRDGGWKSRFATGSKGAKTAEHGAWTIELVRRTNVLLYKKTCPAVGPFYPNDHRLAFGNRAGLKTEDAGYRGGSTKGNLRFQGRWAEVAMRRSPLANGRFSGRDFGNRKAGIRDYRDAGHARDERVKILCSEFVVTFWLAVAQA